MTIGRLKYVVGEMLRRMARKVLIDELEGYNSIIEIDNKYIHDLNKSYTSTTKELDRLEKELSSTKVKAQAIDIGFTNYRQRTDSIAERASMLVDADRILHLVETCQSKILYHTPEGANYAALALYYKDGRFVEPYKCKVCPYYHLTRSDRGNALVGRELVRKGRQDSLETQTLGNMARYSPETEEYLRSMTKEQK